MRVRGVVVSVVAGALALLVVGAAGGALAAKIRGTAGADTIRGTARADTIYGLAGNDKLYGLGGNDLLIGGPGVDSIFCGPGRDRVLTDGRDRVARDCEIVTRTGGTPPPPPPPAQAGSYLGSTSHNERITFDVVDGGRTVTNIRISAVNFSCDPRRQNLSGPFDRSTARIVIGPDGTFQAAGSGPTTVGPYAAFEEIVLTGRFAGSIGSGAFQWNVTFNDGQGQLRCTSGPVTWNASRL